MINVAGGIGVVLSLNKEERFMNEISNLIIKKNHASKTITIASKRIIMTKQKEYRRNRKNGI